MSWQTRPTQRMYLFVCLFVLLLLFVCVCVFWCFVFCVCFFFIVIQPLYLSDQHWTCFAHGGGSSLHEISTRQIST